MTQICCPTLCIQIEALVAYQRVQVAYIIQARKQLSTTFAHRNWGQNWRQSDIKPLLFTLHMFWSTLEAHITTRPLQSSAPTQDLHRRTRGLHSSTLQTHIIKHVYLSRLKLKHTASQLAISTRLRDTEYTTLYSEAQRCNASCTAHRIFKAGRLTNSHEACKAHN